MLPILPTDILPTWVRGHYETWLYMIGIFVLLKPIAYLTLRILAQQYTYTVFIRKSDEAYDMLLGWIFAAGIDKGARSVIARVGVRGGGLIEEEAAAAAGPSPKNNNKKRITFSPWNGALLFWFHGRPVYFKTHMRQVGLLQEEEVTVVSLGRSAAPLRNLLEECRQLHLRQTEQRVAIFGNHGSAWSKEASRVARPLSTVAMDRDTKEQLVADMARFVNPATQRWYAQRGIPYRRGYLFYGQPGTGKTSLSLSVAGHFDLDIYRIQVSGITDDSLKQLFEKLPERCVVLLEDVDVIAKSRAASGGGSPSGADSGHPADAAVGTTMSGLLNIIDGVSSQEGRILIMTTNYAARLDAALVRPGRIDVRVEFPLADRNAAKNLFDLVYRNPVDPTEDSSSEKDKLHLLADSFASKLPERQVSPAEVMSFLLQYQESPQQAVDCVQEWLASRASRQLQN
ncbi:mitochondrial chaperone BCS1 [Beauveria bassiana ARSEF 2860]|uniref:Mitochondrial chaperone BCS1 n=1 Tax=Beauveria bassiana (strain ARSEF 2860) TaxID=655819 RepID=J4USN7_BEAB2|nr:mitochondrial chaperone BCS1 [Beauveria bassiana ARSEF 2860]EJP68697.1 mitochondrial chaperone BCS1 [Beauveria bassiana ARSEF 2860]